MKINIPPASSFKSQSAIMACMLKEWMIARLFWTKKLITINDKGELNFSHLGVDYSYQLFDPEKFFTYKKSRVIIHFSIDKPDPAFLFKEENNEFICDVSLRPTWTKDKPEILHKHVGSLNKIHAYIKRKRNEDRISADAGDPIAKESRIDNLTRRLNKKLAAESMKQHTLTN